MKRLDLLFLGVRVPLDYCAVLLAAFAAYFLRFQTFVEFRPATQIIGLPAYMALAAVLASVWILSFTIHRLYVPGRMRTLDEIGGVIAGCSTALVVLVLLIFFRRELFASRFIILAVWGLSIVFVLVERMCLRALQTYLYKKGIGSRLVAVVGRGRTAAAIAEELTAHPTAGYAVIGRLPDLSDKSLAQLKVLREQKGLEEIFYADPQPTVDRMAALVAFSDAYQVGIRYSADMLVERRVGLDVAMFGGVPFVEIRKTPLEGWGRIYKRAFDVVFSALLLVLSLPLMAVIAILIVLDSPGPVLFTQIRIGERGEAFRFHKFRSMTKNADRQWAALSARASDRRGPVPKMKNDPRVTRVGRVLRRYSLDEMPQFFDVLIGKMSLVGPRPHLPQEVARYHTMHRKVLTIRPGLTGLPQISGRADLSFEDEVKLDISYIERWSPKLDLSILLKTPLAVLSRKGAY